MMEENNYDPYCPVCGSCGEDGCCSATSCKQHSEETKKKLSEKRLGKYCGEQNKPIII